MMRIDVIWLLIIVDQVDGQSLLSSVDDHEPLRRLHSVKVRGSRARFCFGPQTGAERGD